MFDPVIDFFSRIFYLIGRGIGMVVAWILWPFVTVRNWYKRQKWLIRVPLLILFLALIASYGYFIFNTQRWANFEPHYANNYKFEAMRPAAGSGVTEGDAKTCQRSSLVDATIDLIDFNVNQNQWISSTLLYKMGLFGVSWDHTPFLDNKASFQRGIHQAVRRISIELVDRLGRVRGTSQIDKDLQDARGNLAFDEYTWYFGISPFGPKTPTPSWYRSSMKSLGKFNDRLARCETVYDARADNLMQLMDRITSDIGSTSDILLTRSENYNSGWFDTRADDRFWFAYGQLYAYSGILKGMRADFDDIVTRRGLTRLWDRLDHHFESALNIQPFIVSNGAESGWIMPTHLATMGLYVLRVRSNLVEARSVLDR